MSSTSVPMPSRLLVEDDDGDVVAVGAQLPSGDVVVEPLGGDPATRKVYRGVEHAEQATGGTVRFDPSEMDVGTTERGP